MIQHKEQYLEFIQRRGVGAHDQVASSPASYCSYLNGVSRLLGTAISPELLNSEEDVERIVGQLHGQREPGTIRNYASAMRQYVAMVRELGLWRSGTINREESSMEEIFTAAEIDALYPSEWVLVEDPVTNESLQVLSGRVRWHGKDRDEVYRKAVELRPQRFALLYTGRIPADTAVVL